MTVKTDLDLCGYDVVHVIKQSRRSVVYVLKRLEDNKYFVAKTPVEMSDEHLARFTNEFANIRKIDSHFVVKAHEFVCFKGSPVLILEYVDGITLDEFLSKNKDLDSKTAFELVRCLILSVKAMHEAKVIHGDVKPSNIMIVKGTYPVFIDFDISQDIREMKNETAGSPGYTSFKQFGQGEYDYSNDIYSLSIVIAMILTGAHPYSIKGKMKHQEWLYMAKNKEFIVDNPIYGIAAKPFVQIIKRALEQNPEHGYNKIDDFKNDLLPLIGKASDSYHTTINLKILGEFKNALHSKSFFRLLKVIASSWREIKPKKTSNVLNRNAFSRSLARFRVIVTLLIGMMSFHVYSIWRTAPVRIDFGIFVVYDFNLSKELMKWDEDGDHQLSYEEARKIVALDLSNKRIRSLRGLKLPNLDMLNLNDNQLTDNPYIPEGISILNLKNTGISKVDIPESVIKVDLSFNKLKQLKFHKNLRELDVSGNKGFTLKNLPVNLERLIAENCDLEHFPVLPPLVRHLDVSSNKISYIAGPIPGHIEFLNLRSNNLEMIDPLPEGLVEILLDYNELFRVGELPDSLVYFSASDNQLTSFPQIKPSLRTVNLNNNKLTRIPRIYEYEHLELELAISGNELYQDNYCEEIEILRDVVLTLKLTAKNQKNGVVLACD